MFDIGGLKWIVILVAVLIFIPPDRWPEIGRTVGKAIAMFRRAQADMSAIVRAEMSEFEKVSKPSTEKKKTITEARKEQEEEVKEEAGTAETVASALYSGASMADAAPVAEATPEPTAESAPAAETAPAPAAETTPADSSASNDEEEERA